jgi:hypothetical protein
MARDFWEEKMSIGRSQVRCDKIQDAEIGGKKICLSSVCCSCRLSLRFVLLGNPSPAAPVTCRWHMPAKKESSKLRVQLLF